MDHDDREFLTEIEQLKANQGTNNSPDPPSSPSLSEHTIFSQDELSFESTTTLPTPLKQPRYTSVETIDSKRSSTSSRTTSAQSGVEKFVPIYDVPKFSRKDARFNRIRPTGIKDEPKEDIELAAWLGPAPILFEPNATQPTSLKASVMCRQSIGEDTDVEMNDQQPTAMTARKDSKTKSRSCGQCRTRHIRCTHPITSAENIVLQPKSTNLRKPKIEEAKSDRTLRIKTEPGENRVKKDGTPYLKNTHDRSKGPSMTPSAVDYRERKVVQQQYQDRLASLLDEDIVNQVEEEGGITPLGRLFKASVRMLERVQLERAGVVETMNESAMTFNTGYSNNMFVPGETGRMYAPNRGEREVSPLDMFKARLQALINEDA